MLVFAGISAAKWAQPNLNVPVARLIQNVSKKLSANPKDAVAAYHLGRLHSMAFADTKGNVQLYGTEDSFEFPSWSTVKVTRESSTLKLTTSELNHLRESLIGYHRAMELDPKNGLYELGYAWMSEQAAAFAAQIGKLPWQKNASSRRQWIDEALSRYWHLYTEHVEADLKAEGRLAGVQDVFVSEDAGKAILRLSPQLPSAKRTEIAANVKKMKDKVVGVTPIVFPLNRNGEFSSLLAPSRPVEFDLAGDGHRRSWSWVTAQTGILVWDPQATGFVTSGRQLFGSATFWLFFDNGYQAMASLDNDRNGWLEGKELSGIAVWTDLNENGRSEPGEVLPVASWKIEAIRTRPTGKGSVLMAKMGIRFSDGGTCPTYDWEPVSLSR